MYLGNFYGPNYADCNDDPIVFLTLDEARNWLADARDKGDYSQIFTRRFIGKSSLTFMPCVYEGHVLDLMRVNSEADYAGEVEVDISFEVTNRGIRRTNN